MIYQMIINAIFIQNSVLMIIGHMIGMNIVVIEAVYKFSEISLTKRPKLQAGIKS